MERRRTGSRRRTRYPDGFQFTRLNLTLLWARLALTATQLSRLTGVTRRQVEWWRRRGYLPPSPEEPDRFNGDAVTLTILIKQGIDAGVPLARAYEMATTHLASILSAGVSKAAGSQVGEQPDESALLDLEQKLRAAYNTIGLVLKAIEPITIEVETDLEAGSAGAQ